ncbi:phosphoenolpyruvate carboxylase [Acidomonas methanolica]|uniref:Phosphoenolpyruvate carboxylase n=1 Tax=Acidomonas methanolica NBRC 104435 TaxID=1231351 RepID=A0A023D5S0_ACIMT|nr:phosphoenolpyruvate carboxylase [Acidomonas methanolica NBRC 104435]GEK97526.1 hypothetical protein AME01nite_00250 [Acidomonas methanolica NBRC 104435]
MRELDRLAAEGRGAADSVQAMYAEIADSLADGSLSVDALEDVVRTLRDDAARKRAARLRAYLALNSGLSPEERLRNAAARLVAAHSDPLALAAAVSRPAFAAVFTAHPTFALASHVYEALEGLADTPDGTLPTLKTHRRSGPPTLADELSAATAAILRGRNALDFYAGAILREAAKRWPDALLAPAPIILSSWVGFDTDGRSDIKWWDTLRIRLALKRRQFERLSAQIRPLLPKNTPLARKIERAIEIVRMQEAACPHAHRHDPQDIATFAKALVSHHGDALTSAAETLPLFEDALAKLDAPARHDLLVARAGFLAHGLSLAHIHTRLNATQIYNAARTRLGIEDDPAIPSRRRVVLTQINEALDTLTPLPVDFGALMTEQSSAAQLMMTMAQTLKHIDSETPIRFLVAETESGFTLLATLWLARLFGIQDRQIEISPLFETQDALEHGEVLLEEAFRSPHWHSYLRANGRICLQFGYSDSGRYVGQIAATNLVERMRLRTLALMKKHGLDDLELVLFDTHGESIGRGAHPFSFADRLAYFSPPHTATLFEQAQIRVREECAFQGGDGYMLFGTNHIAEATIAAIAEHSLRDLHHVPPDPIYDEPDFSSDFFSTIALSMTGLVADPGYSALLGAFGPALIDKTGSRPSARQGDGVTVARITHPSQLRAIPNNAILQQLGWYANTLQGLGEAISRHNEEFEIYSQNSARFSVALDFARQALAHSDLGVLRATLRLFDPGTWLDRAAQARDDETMRRFMDLSKGLEDQEFWRRLPAMFRRLQADHLKLRMVWRDAPRMESDEKLLHAIRTAIIQTIWMISTRIPYFSPRNNISREAITAMIVRLDIETAVQRVAQIFPLGGDDIDGIDFHEPAAPRESSTFRREHEDIIQPMLRLFALLREVGVAIMHRSGAFG